MRAASMVNRDGLQRRFVGVGRMALGGLTLLLLVVLGRVVQLQVRPSEALQAHFTERIGGRPELAPRGDLRDRRGRLLATSAFGWRVFVDPSRLADPPDQTIVELADALGMNVDAVGTRIMQRVARNEERRLRGEPLIRYVSIGSALEEWQVEAVRRLNRPGVHLERVPVRSIVDAPAAASLVGLVGVDDNGWLGAEHAFENKLKPTEGKLRYTRDARGRTLWVEVGSYQPSMKGDDVRLSIDLAIQDLAVAELERGVTEADAAGGRVIVLDPQTGEILAMADIVRERDDVVPFDAKLIDRSTGRGPRFAVLRPDPNRLIDPALARHRCIEDVYEPGSPFKAFMWSAVTELGRMSPDDVLDTHDGRWRTSYGRPLEDVTPRSKQSWRDVLVNSSNIGMQQGVEKLTFQEMRDAVLKLGFGRRTGIPLPGEAAGIVTDAKSWSKYTQTSVAMGYEIAVTPLQMVRAFAAFAREGALAGTIPTLRLTAAHGREPQEDVMYRVFPEPVALLARDAMVGVAEKMDTRLYKLGRFDHKPRYPMFGKSGTANFPRPDGRGYIEGQYISSFIAAAPVQNPRIVVLVIIDDPGPELARKKMHYGSYAAGPVVRRIVERVLPYLGVPAQGVE